MELLLDICCLWVWSTEQGGKDSDKLGHYSLTKIKAICQNICSPLFFHFNEISVQVCGWSSGWCWLRMS